MLTRRGIISIAGCAFTLIAAAAAPTSAPEACSLLTAADAAVALGTKAYDGKRQMPQDATGCVWSDDPEARDSSRRLVLNTHTIRAWQMLMSSTSTMQKLEPVAGIGDEAVYVTYPPAPTAPPFIWFKKGDVAISIRILIGTKPNPFSFDVERAKLAVLAKTAAAKL